SVSEFSTSFLQARLCRLTLCQPNCSSSLLAHLVGTHYRAPTLSQKAINDVNRSRRPEWTAKSYPCLLQMFPPIAADADAIAGCGTADRWRSQSSPLARDGYALRTPLDRTPLVAQAGVCNGRL